jgi:hypothetical protein
MTNRHPLCTAVGLAILLASCGEAMAPGIEGRWATRGIELVAASNSAMLRLACDFGGRLDHGIVPDMADSVQFTVPLWRTDAVLDFAGQFEADTLTATVTWRWSGGSQTGDTYRMVRDGDPDFLSFACLASADRSGGAQPN